MINSRAKGARAERQWRDELREAGFQARRGQQYCGANGDADVVSDDLPLFHFEVKAVQRLNLDAAMAQAKADCGPKYPVVVHRKDRGTWNVTMPSGVFFKMLRGDHLGADNAESE
jgi:hypothetical protein